MEYIENRSFLVISAKRPMAEWVASTEGPEAVSVVETHRSVYLVPPLDNPSTEQVEKLAARHFSAIFENELFSWYTDRAMWPTTRDLETFYQWFSYEYVEEGFDLASGVIEKE
ncbi:MAG: hypothetical protein ACLFQW_03045 [Spirochaetaceae bacterium]